MQLYNTKTRTKENFKPMKQDIVKIYFCGPTVYNYAHIGNLRTYVFEDVLIKTLKYLGYKTKTVMNITDVDDKTIKASIENKMSLSDFTKKYTDIFLEDIKKIGINPADEIVPITTLMPEMTKIINKLLTRKIAYLGDDNSIYYDISKFADYGKFANLDFSGMKKSVRIDNDEYDKENASDFVLWKAWKNEDGENFWEEKFIINGEEKILKGRPGWHIECSACNMKYFGPQIDIHMGGVDLIFPHHQNEIAQTESLTGKEFSAYWLHSGHLMVDGKKMAKSAKNFYTISDIINKYKDIPENITARAIRLSFINGKYRENIDFSFSKLESNIVFIKKIDELIKKLKRTYDNLGEENNKVSKDFSQSLQNFMFDYVESLEDDLNTPIAISVFSEFITYLNSRIDSLNITKKEILASIDFLKSFNRVLSIIDFSFFEKEDEIIPENILKLFESRNESKKDKNFEMADKYREELLSLGYKIIDDRTGTKLEKI
ncbi:MAG: cysteine--tRNA ligase [Candidatus Gracilibacteria bacterium]|nr:cysteine--tRNA ligase [Candidatus Gracilibacteria bacterium]